ncbi:unnamed protein product [Microthlaspi erraticum]|uniref:WAT1-related protein n=1 Tax=Microthlaspi erraticum TaxID=1685480 RepID=A0A6D2KGS0_9BRAS|nr:unnamed protein product [Microthlaspi erraticum]
MGSMDAKWETIVPFIAMALMEACTIALTILAKTALTGGMSPFVFIVYTNALGSLLLLPYSFFFHRGERDDEPFLTKPSLVRIFLLGFTGEGKLEWESMRTKGRVVGTLICFTGAFVEIIYLGPFIRPSPSSSPNSNFLTTISHYLTFFKNSENWALGSLLLACATLSISIWNIIQLDTVQKYPQVMKVVSAYSLAGTLQCAIFSAFMEPDIDAWKLELNMDLYLIIATVCLVYYVELLVNSVLGAAIAGTGYLLIMWSQAPKDDQKGTVEENDNYRLDSDDQTTPLLLGNGDVDQV